jgi:drug/metabolite transporter (DMT)-like permease
VAFVVCLSLVAAFLFAAAAAIQQRVASRADLHELHGRPFALMSRLLRRPMWLAGWGTNATGFFAQSAALQLGGVAIVQPLLTTQLLFAVPLGTFRTPRRPSRADWLGTLAVCGGLVVFFQGRAAASLDGHVHRGVLLVTIPFAAAFIAGLSAIGLPQRIAMPGAVRAAILGVAAAVAFAYSASFIVLTTHDMIGPGIAHTATDWPGYALAVSSVTGILIGQHAFAVGTLPPALATMNIVNPVTSYVLGVTAFGTPLPNSVMEWIALAAGGVLVSAGVWALAASPTARAAGEPADEVEERPALADEHSS